MSLRSASKFGVAELMTIGNLYSIVGEYDRTSEFMKITELQIQEPQKLRHANFCGQMGDIQFRLEDKNRLRYAREYFLEGLKLYREGRRRNYANQWLYYFQTATILAADEVFFGDFKCASDLAIKLAAIQTQIPSELGVQQLMLQFTSNKQSWIKIDTQSADGCPYELPIIR